MASATPPNGAGPGARPATILIAEPDELMRDALAALCQVRGNYRLAGLASTGPEAMEATMALKPDLALISPDLGGLYALELTSKCVAAGLPTRFVILASRYDRRAVLEALRAGAKGFVLRAGSTNDLFEALDQVRAGGVYLAPQARGAKILLDHAAEPADDPVGHLSTREYQVFTMLVDGVRAKEIATRLELSPKTVDTYRASLMRKLDIYDVAGLVKFAVRSNLVTPEQRA
jgi:DNA-binding NarL/FixJ family response regulator